MVLFSIVLICASVAMVYSASSHTVKGTLNVSYQAINVGATVSAQYQKAGGSATSMTTTGSQGGPTSLTFNVSDTSPEGSLSWSDPILLDDDHPYVLFTYSFHNDATSGADPFYVSLNNGMSGSAFTVYYYTDDVDYNTSTELESKRSTVRGSGVASPVNLGTNNGKVTVPATSTVYIYILVEAAVVSENATYSGLGNNNNNNNNVSFVLSHFLT